MIVPYLPEDIVDELTSFASLAVSDDVVETNPQKEFWQLNLDNWSGGVVCLTVLGVSVRTDEASQMRSENNVVAKTARFTVTWRNENLHRYKQGNNAVFIPVMERWTSSIHDGYMGT